MDYQLAVAEVLHPHLKEHFSLEEIRDLVEKPKSADHGDVAFPAFQLAKVFRKAPAEIAADLEEKISSPLVEKTETVGPYLNFFLKRDIVGKEIVSEVLEKGAHYGDSDFGKDKNVPVDMSSPNIAKPMSLGHLRSTVIGNSLAKIYAKLGFTPVKINHIGDWGTQFGKLIVAYKKWGEEEKVRANPIAELLDLYVHFHKEVEEHPELEEEGRLWFKKLEDGDPEALELWEWFREESLNEFNKVYDRLNITFDAVAGEAFYNDKMDEVVELLDEKDLLVEDKGARIVDLEKYDLNPALIQKTDGATLYITRDLAAALYRHRKYDFYEALYVVGQEQSNHFNQLKAVLKEMGYGWADDIHHIPFGLITQGGKKLSTRQGKVVLLEEVLDEAVEQALAQINEKNPDLNNKEHIAEQVGVGAIVFHDLKNDRLNTFDFTIEELVQFEGETGPYVMYSRARAMSILRKAEAASLDTDSLESFHLSDDYSWEIIKLLQVFPEMIQRAFDKYEPSVIAKHALNLAQAFNKFYANVRVLEDHEEQPSRLALVRAVTEVLKEDLNLLGVEAPDEM